MRAIIIAAGEAKRWKNHLGISKHLAEVDGEPILHRTVRLLKKYTDDIVVVAKLGDERYVVKGAATFHPTFDPAHFDADKFLNSKELWNRRGRTVVLYGDVFFTEHTMQTIMEFTANEWRLFGRAYKSQFTGTPWGECFAQNFHAAQVLQHEAALLRIVDLFRQGVIKRCGGWEAYRQLQGIPPSMMNTHWVGPSFTNIDTFTEDFDTGEEYDQFIENREAYIKKYGRDWIAK